MADHPGQRRVEARDTSQDVDPKLWLGWTLATIAGWAMGEFIYRVFGELLWGAVLFRGTHVLGVGVAVLQGPGVTPAPDASRLVDRGNRRCRRAG